jgi:DNA-binding Lrp family transcriptional regulator
MMQHTLTQLDQELLNRFQRDFPLTSRPYAALAEELGTTEELLLARLALLRESGILSRVGAVLRHHRVGVSTLAAMEVPPERMGSVAAMINAREEVNHNYEREHRLNLWFVLTAADAEHLRQTVADIEQQTGLAVFCMPMEADFHIDLGFPLTWQAEHATDTTQSDTSHGPSGREACTHGIHGTNA